jgi:hypothetical protein
VRFTGGTNLALPAVHEEENWHTTERVEADRCLLGDDLVGRGAGFLKSWKHLCAAFWAAAPTSSIQPDPSHPQKQVRAGFPHALLAIARSAIVAALAASALLSARGICDEPKIVNHEGHEDHEGRNCWVFPKRVGRFAK